MDYRIMIHPSGDIKELLENQLNIIAKEVYGKDTQNVVFRIKTEQSYGNRRKLFIPGGGEIIEMELAPHITLSQKIEIDEKDENKLIAMLENVIKIRPFDLTSANLGDYGEYFTIFLSFSQNVHLDELRGRINDGFKDLFSKEKEKRDIPHITLVYDDMNERNFKKAWSVIDRNILMGKQISVKSIWLWKGWSPYKEFKLVSQY